MAHIWQYPPPPPGVFLSCNDFNPQFCLQFSFFFLTNRMPELFIQSLTCKISNLKKSILKRLNVTYCMIHELPWQHNTKNNFLTSYVTLKFTQNKCHFKTFHEIFQSPPPFFVKQAITLKNHRVVLLSTQLISLHSGNWCFPLSFTLHTQTATKTCMSQYYVTRNMDDLCW